MIDFINISIIENNRFEFTIEKDKTIELLTNFNTSTGEILKYPKRAKYHNFNIRLNECFSKIIGSFHKYYNLLIFKEEHNYNDFSYKDFVSILPDFINKFDLDNNCSITKLEFGLNIELDIDPENLIKHNLIMQDYRTHNIYEEFKGKGDLKRFDKTDYKLKIYNKSKQYRIEKHILRVELKLDSKRKIQSFGIYNLYDLIDKDKLKKLFDFLMKEFKKSIIIDNLEFDNLPIEIQKKLITYSNPNFWSNLRRNKEYKKITRLKNHFNLLLSKYKLDTIKYDIENKLYEKFEILIQ